MSKIIKRHKQIILSIPEDIFRRATHTLKIKGDELKDYLMDFLEKSVKIEAKPDYVKDPIWNIVGLGKSKAGDLSIKHDKYLYEAKKR